MLSFGTAGCNLACRFCQNWDISKSRDVDTLADAASPEALADAAVRLGCRSVAFTYNDPVIFLEYAIDVADACRARGVKAVAVTAGYVNPEPGRRVLRAHGRGERRPEGVHRGLLPRRLRRAPRAGAGHPGAPRARDRRLVRAHDAADPRAERLGRRARRDDALGRRAPGARRADALHRVPSGLEDARPATYPARDPPARPPDRDPERRPLRVHGERRRPRRSDDPVPRV